MEAVKGTNTLTDIIVLNDLLDKDLDDCVECGIGEIPIQPTLLNNKSDPLSEENLEKSLELVNKIRLLCPEKSIWLYTGYTWEDIFNCCIITNNIVKDLCNATRQEIVEQCDFLVDGQYINSQRDITLRWRGSTNQKLIDIQQSLQKGEVVLWTN